MKNLFLMCCLVSLAISCDDPIENNSRHLVLGSIAGIENQPIDSIDVSTRIVQFSASTFNFPALNSREILGIGTTDLNGNYNIVSLGTKNSPSDLLLTVNVDGSDIYARGSKNPDFGVVSVILESIRTPEIEIPTVTLRRKSTLTFETLNLSGTLDTLNYFLEVPKQHQIVSLNQIDSLSFDRYSRSTIIEPQTTQEIPTLEGANARLRYTFRNGNTIISESIEFPINTTQASYVFEY